tara:strand:+ start:47 stop:175 length:129 start_codon:yes stop_codon:yes gene_type:complete
MNNRKKIFFMVVRFEERWNMLGKSASIFLWVDAKQKEGPKKK